jgi:hypothetical protein
MQLPFTHEQFLAVFAAFNGTWWPVVVVLWLLTAVALGALATGRARPRVLFLLLAVLWAWSGVAYHWVSFAPINPAARLFGALFVLEAVLFVWFGVVRRGPAFAWGRSPRQVLSIVFGGYALLYPLVGLVTGLRWPAMPVFGVPCPTALLTVSLLLALEPGRLRGLMIVPLAWAVVGGTAALTLGMTPDYALFVGGAALLLVLAAPRLLDARAPVAPAG